MKIIENLIDRLERRFLWKSPARALSVYLSIPENILQSFRRANFKKTLLHAAKNSRFYREKWASLKTNPERATIPSDLENFFTIPADIQGADPEAFVCGPADTAFETTGTVSRRSKRVYFSRREISDAGRIGAAGLWYLGIRPEDRFVSAFDYSFWVSGPTLKASLDALGAFHIEAGRMDPEEFYERVAPYRCTVIVADPGWLVRLSEYAEKKGPWPVKVLIAGGENLSESSRRFVESVWKAPLLLSYGQTEAFGMIGMECHKQCGYHLNDMDLWAEIVDPDADGYGELVYTTLRRTVMPIIRYRSGDITKLMTEPCACGSRSPRLAKLRGRADAMVVTGVGNIAAWMIESAVEESGLLLSDWQLAIGREGRKDLLEFRYETSRDLSVEAARAALMDGMSRKMAVAAQGITQGLAAFTTTRHNPGALRGAARKTRRIVDGRDFAA